MAGTGGGGCDLVGSSRSHVSKVFINLVYPIKELILEDLFLKQYLKLPSPDFFTTLMSPSVFNHLNHSLQSIIVHFIIYFPYSSTKCKLLLLFHLAIFHKATNHFTCQISHFNRCNHGKVMCHCSLKMNGNQLGLMTCKY